MKKRGPKRKGVTAEQIVEFIQRCLCVTWSIVLLRFLISKETVRRRLQESGHTLVRSLNKNKRYFTLKSLIQVNMDRNGIWECNGVVFSIYEDAKTTVRNLINRSKCGWTELELRDYLKIVAKGALVELYNAGLVSRAKFGRHYVYFSKDAEKRKKQISLRHRKEPRCGIKFDAGDLEMVLSKVGARLRKIVTEVLESRGIKDEQRWYTDIVIASFLRPLLRRWSDRDLEVYLRNHPGLDGFFNFLKGTPGHTVISSMKAQLGEEGCKQVMYAILSWILEVLEIKELIVALDTTHAFKSQNNKWGIKIHAAGISPYGIPLCVVLMEDGKAHDITTLRELVEQIRSFGITVKYVIGDGAYDDKEFYYIVDQILEAEGIARYNPRRSGFNDAPANCGIIEHLVSIRKEYVAKKEKDKRRKGRKRKNPLRMGIILSDPATQGEMLRNFPLTPWGSEERKDIYKLRTLIERIFSILKSWLGLEALSTHSKSARIFNVYSSFISLLTVAMVAIELGIPDAMLRVSIIGF